MIGKEYKLSFLGQFLKCDECGQTFYEGIAEAKKIQGSRFTVKQMERTKKSLETRLKRLHDQSRKDDMITFEGASCEISVADFPWRAEEILQALVS